MKKLSLLILLATSLSISACSIRSNTFNNEEDTPQTPTDSGDGENEPIEDDEVDDCPIDHISLNKSSIDLIVNKYEYLSVNFYPDDDTTADLHDGVWSVADSSIATVSQVGKVTGVAPGKTIVTFTTNEGKRRGNCVVYVFASSEDIVREYVKVTDADSIQPGDQIVFGCPEFGVAASIDRLSGYLKTTPTTFSSDKNKITFLGSNAGEYYVGQGKDEALTLESQENKYLAGKTNDYKNSLVFVNSKGAINWIFEIPEGYSNIYSVNYDLYDDLWLMFNKINDSDIRFNLYDSNPTALMVMPTIYRLTIIK